MCFFLVFICGSSSVHVHVSVCGVCAYVRSCVCVCASVTCLRACVYVHMCECKGAPLPGAHCAPPLPPTSVTPARTQTASMVQLSGLWTSAYPRTPQTTKVRPASAHLSHPLHTWPPPPWEAWLAVFPMQPRSGVRALAGASLTLSSQCPEGPWVQLGLGHPVSDAPCTLQIMNMRMKMTRTWSLTPPSPWSLRVGGQPLSLGVSWGWNPEQSPSQTGSTGLSPAPRGLSFPVVAQVSGGLIWLALLTGSSHVQVAWGGADS